MLILYLSVVFYRYGSKALKPGFKINLQQDIANNRRVREHKQVVDFDPFDEDAPDPLAK